MSSPRISGQLCSLCFRFDFADNQHQIISVWSHSADEVSNISLSSKMSQLKCPIYTLCFLRYLLNVLFCICCLMRRRYLHQPSCSNLQLHHQPQSIFIVKGRGKQPQKKPPEDEKHNYMWTCFKYKAELNSMNKTFSGLPFCQPFNQSIQKTLYIAAYVYLRYLP